MASDFLSYMKITMPCLSALFLSLTFAKSQVAVVEPTVALLQTPELDNAGLADNTVAATRSIRATIPAGEEAWIPLGNFNYGGNYRITASSAGHSANSSAIAEFSIAYGGNIHVHRISSYRVQSSFDFYSTRGGGDTGVGLNQRRYVMLKYKNVSGGSNTVTATITIDRANDWSDATINNFAALTESDRMIPAIGNERVINPGLPGYNGVKINGNTEITGNLSVNGEEIVTSLPGTPASSFSMGARFLTRPAAENSFEFGDFTAAIGKSSFAALGATTWGVGSIAIGSSAQAGDSANNTTVANSVAIGVLTKATKPHTVAMGTRSEALGNYSVAIGWQNKAIGEASTSLGAHNNVSGPYSASVGASNNVHGGASLSSGWGNTVYGQGSVALGFQNTVGATHAENIGNNAWTLPHSVAVGSNNSSTGAGSVAIGTSNIATGSAAAAFNQNNVASGGNSTAFGNGSRANGRAEFVVGEYNVLSGGSGNTISGNDVLFAVGNGSGPEEVNRSNALEVRRDGSVIINSPQGDISMGIFGG